MTTLEHLQLGLGITTSSQQGFHAKTSASQTAIALDWTANAQDCSLKPSESFASADPVTSSWKTSQRSLVPTKGEIWGQYSGSFPRSGTMRNGKLYQRAPLVPITFENGSGLLPTPTATDDKDRSAINVFWTGNGTIRHKTRHGYKSCARLSQVLHHLGRPDLAVSARFREWMMGYPLGWTAGVLPKSGVKAMGNSIVPQVAAIALKRILDKEFLIWSYHNNASF